MAVRSQPATPGAARNLSGAVLVLLLLVFGGLATVYNAVTPLGEGPDEPGHMAYVFFIARSGRLPVQTADPAEAQVPGQGHHAPLAYVLLAPATLWLPPEQRAVVLSANPQFRWNGGDEAAAFIRGSNEYWPWQGATLAWRLARFGSTLYGAAVVACTYLIARRMQPAGAGVAFALLASAFVVGNPQFLFTAALVTNDTLLAALIALLTWLCIAWPVVRLTPGFALVGGLLFGLALLTKQNALVLAPLLAWGCWRVSGGKTGKWLKTLSLATLVTVAVAGWWFARNWLLYGDLFGLALFRERFAGQPFVWRDPAAWGGALQQLFTSFWAYFGWLSLRPPEWVYWLYGSLTAGGLFGLLHAAWAGRRNWPGLRAATLHPLAGLVLLTLLVFVWTGAFALTAGLVAWQGRMLFPALPAVGILLALGWWRIAAGAARYAVPALSAGMAGLALYLALGVIAPAYEWRTLPPDVARARIATPAYARFARSWQRGAELRGWRLAGDLQPGATVTVTLTWHALERMPDDWTVFLHLVDSENQIVAEDNRRPQNGALPTNLWTAGDWLEDAHPLVLPADLSPGDYRLHVGFYLPQDDGQRLSVWAADGAFVDDFVFLGTLTVQ